MELVRSIIEHKKVLVVALNGPAVGGGAAWFLGLADIIFAVESSFLQVPFSALGLVPENGSIRNFAQSMGVHRANDFLMFGRKLTAQELEQWGLVNRILPAAGFHEGVEAFLQEQLRVNDGRSMMLAKQLQNAPLRAERLLALYDAADALAERFVDGAPLRRLAMKGAELEGELLRCMCHQRTNGRSQVKKAFSSVTGAGHVRGDWAWDSRVQCQFNNRLFPKRL